MTGEWFDSGVLVGYGSIGRVHGRVLAPRCQALVVVDALAAARDRAAADLPGATVVSSIDEGLAAVDPSTAVVVIATWGPSHRELFDRVVDAGCRHVLVEKPIADSVAAGEAMVSRAAELDVALGVNYVRRYGGEAEALLELGRRHQLGPPVGLAVHGGARGLVTNGIHTVELACDLLGEAPVAVVSTARGERINPRSPDLCFYGGTAVWSWADGRELVVSFPLVSSLKEHLVVYHRDALVTVADGVTAQVRRRPPDDVAAHPAITWTGVASEPVWEGPLPGARRGDDRVIGALEAVWRRDAAQLRPAHHTRALGACVGALLAGESGGRVGLPIDPDGEAGRRRWPIS